MKILYITPHLSTGGLPQYLTKKIELLYQDHEIHVVEYDNISSDFVVQRNKIQKLLGINLTTLDQYTHHHLPHYINNIGFDVVHFEEFSESFINGDILKKIYTSDRKYKIFETTHSSHKQEKIFLPDAFIFVSSAHIKMYGEYNVPASIVEYPIEHKVKSNRDDALNKLGLDPNKKHVLNVGLFTPGKNQGEIFEYAKHLPDHVFHFVGNQAGNFEFYWGDLMKKKPDNCVVWGERSDVELFYDAADMFLFTSKFELNPLVIKEALCWNLPVLMYNLPIYNNDFDKYKNIVYLTDDINTNLSLIKQDLLDITKEIVVITTYPNTPEKEALLIELINNVKSFGYDVMISSHYNVPEYIQNMVNYNVIDLTDNLLYKEEYQEYNVSSYIYNSNQQRYMKRSMSFNHGFSVWTLWQNAVNNLDDTKYDKIHFIDYDCIISDVRYLQNHSQMLTKHDFVFYKSTDMYEFDRVTTNLFSLNYGVSVELFNRIKTKKDLFDNKYGTSILEQILYKMLIECKYNFVHLPSNDLHRYNTKFDMICVQDLNITDYTDGIFGFNVYSYDDNYDILYVKNLSKPILINGYVFNEHIMGDKFLLLYKKNEQIIEYNGVYKKYIMLEHEKHNSIIINDKTILDERFIK